MSIENGNQAHEVQNDSYDAWQNMASEIRQESTTKNYSDARREGGLPEYIRDEQDYKEWRAEQDVKKSESLKKDQEIFNQIRSIEDPIDRDFATVCLGMSYQLLPHTYDNLDGKNLMPFVLNFLDRDDKGQNWEDFFLDETREQPTSREDRIAATFLYQHVRELQFDEAYEIKKIASKDTKKHFEKLATFFDEHYSLNYSEYSFAHNHNYGDDILSAEIIFLAEKELENIANSEDITDVKKSERKLEYLAEKSARPDNDFGS